MKCFKNVRVYLEGEGIVRTSLSFDERIQNIGEACGEEIVIPENAVVLPGFIDRHMHGAGGADFMDGSVEAIETIAKTIAQEGTVACLATTVSDDLDKIRKALHAFREYKETQTSETTEVVGVHLEGPFICPKFKGGMKEIYIIPPSVEILKEFVDICGDCVKLITYAPDCDEEGVLLKAMLENNMVPSLGHTNATTEQIAKAIGNGLQNVTHTFNAMRALHHREIGVVGSALLYDELHCELIADEIHVSVPAIQLLLKCKPKDKVVLITDAMRAKGAAEGVSEIGGQIVIVKNGEVRMENGTLAGSVLKMNVAIRNLVEDAKVAFTDAVDFATKNPAKTLGIDKDYGTIAVGKKASFAILDDAYNVLYTIVNGKVVYKRED